MFTGIIEHKAKILDRQWGLFRVENTFDDILQIGQSIAHDWACMTLTNITPEFYEFFVMKESLWVTNFSEKQKWDFFNVERSMKLSDRIDGHIVSGHVDAVWKVILKEMQGDGSCLLGFEYPNDFDPFIIRKWSITVNGVSLTVVWIEPWIFTVSLIPLTQDWTNLGNMNGGEKVNLEFDFFAKYIFEQSKKYLQKEPK